MKIIYMSKYHSNLSINITKKLDKNTKKKEGIFFTPINIVELNLKLLEKYFNNIKSILEPSCGSCVFISEIMKKYKDKNITGIEKNKKIYESIKNLNDDKLKIVNDDFLTYSFSNNFDLILGNPPYFVIKKKDIDKYYFEYFNGRPNIFILFIIKSLQLLNNNGILSFVIPKNFLNCQYYNNTRKYIFENFLILDIVNCDDGFMETKQKTIIFIVQNKKGSNNEFCLIKNSSYIFDSKDNIIELKKLYQNSKSLNELKFEVKVGNLVWNQNKNILTDDTNKTRLIYNSDIVKNKLILKSYKNELKKNFIDKKGMKDIVLLINRGHGVGNYKFEYYLLDDKIEYLIENHLIYIKSLDTEGNDAKEKLKKIINSLNDDRTKHFIELYCSNNALNTNELRYLLPIYGM